MRLSEISQPPQHTLSPAQQRLAEHSLAAIISGAVHYFWGVPRFLLVLPAARA